MEIQTKEMLRIKRWLNEIMVEHTGQPMEVITRDADRDFFLTAEETVQYGIVGAEVRRREEAAR